jgi:glucokinase
MQPAPGLVIGFDLGGTKMHAAAVDVTGRVLHAERQKTQASDGAATVIRRMAELIRAVAGKLGQPVRAVCVGVPGGVDEPTGMVDKAPNLGWEKVPLGSLLSAALDGAPVYLDNDVRVAVVGEHAFGAGRGTRCLVGVFVGTGIGGGLIFDGAMHLGARGVAGEVGHMVLKPGGPRCPCGKRGCVEALASRTAMERQLRKRIALGVKSQVLARMEKQGRGHLTSSVIARALDEEDPAMVEVMARAQRYLAILVSNLINAIDPEVVVIGGGIAERLGDRFVAPIRAGAYKRLLVQRDRERIRIVATALKDDAAPVGAAHLAWRQIAGAMPPRAGQ